MRLCFSAVFVTIFATLALSAVDIAGQGKPAYAPPRTPWGDPDLQGTYTNKYEQSTPLERPEDSPDDGSRTWRVRSWLTFLRNETRR
jgi:hypothetical protein